MASTAYNKKNKHSDLYSMGGDFVERMEALLVRGLSTRKVAQRIQDEWGLLKDIKVETLAKKVLRYKVDIMDHHLQTEVVVKSNAEGAPKDTTETHKIKRIFRKSAKIDVLEELEELVKFQMHRVERIAALEDPMPTVLKQTREEVRELSNLLKQMSELQMDVGLMNRVPHKVRGKIDLQAPVQREEENLLRERIANKNDRMEATNRLFSLLEEVIEEEIFGDSGGTIIEATDIP